MKRGVIVALLFSFFLTSAPAQVVQWANAVVGYSSEGKGEPFSQQYKAGQILGKPNRLPRPGDNPCAWSPLAADGTSDEWITVRFPQPIPIQQIAVFESGNPGAITNVLVVGSDGKETSVYRPGPAAEGGVSSPLRIFPTEPLLANSVKLVLSPARVKGPNQIDAVAISPDKQPVEVTINVSKDIPKGVAKENLGKQVNSKGQEVAPVISPDGRTLFFTRGEYERNIGSPQKQDVWYSQLQGGGWGEAVNMGGPINTADDNAISGLSPDGRTMYLINVYKPDGSIAFGLSKSTRTKSGWSFPVECKIKNNYNLHKDSYTEYAIAPDGKIMVLSVQRKDSRGDKDLYVSFLQPDQTWSEPQNMGGVLNTADYEGAPFVATDSRTLYFTSSGQPEYGKGDIFVSRRLDDTWMNWSEPENLGPTINTPEWDGYFTIPASGEYAYLSSMQNSMGSEDVFRVKLFPAIKPQPVAILSGQVIDAQSRKPLASEVLSGVATANKEPENKIDYDPEVGDFKLILPVEKVYNLTARKDGYFPTTEVIDLTRDKRYRDIRKNIYLVPIKSGQKIVLREVLFQQSKAELLDGSATELDQVADMLSRYPSMEILVEGHTDNQGEWNLNMKLSEDRVKVVKEYLAGKGVAAGRVQTKAWGPSKPIASNETEEKRRLNRRVEFTILKM